MGSEKNWKIGAIVAALIPTLFLLVFAVGEGAGGIGHYGQLVPIALLAIFGWYAPRPSGFVLLFGGIALMIIYAISAKAAPLSVLALVELIVFAPLVVSGICFLRADRFSLAQ